MITKTEQCNSKRRRHVIVGGGWQRQKGRRALLAGAVGATAGKAACRSSDSGALQDAATILADTLRSHWCKIRPQQPGQQRSNYFFIIFLFYLLHLISYRCS